MERNKLTALIRVMRVIPYVGAGACAVALVLSNVLRERIVWALMILLWFGVFVSVFHLNPNDKES